MKNPTDVTNNNKKSSDLRSIRIKSNTKNRIDKKLESINKSSEFGKVNYDKFMNFLIENLSNKQIELLQKSTITWRIEEPRLKKIWSKKNGKIQEDRWKEMLYTGQLQEFIKEHYRLPVEAA